MRGFHLLLLFTGCYQVREGEQCVSSRDGWKWERDMDVMVSLPRFRSSSRGHDRYTANPAGVVVVNTLQSASNWMLKSWTGFVAVME